MIRAFHDGMSAQVIGGDAPPFPVTNGVKEGCALAPTLFSVLFSLMQGLKAKTKVTDSANE